MTKYRIIKVTPKGEDYCYYIVQYKYFLCWHTFQDPWECDVRYFTLEGAQKAIWLDKEKDKREVVYTE